MIYPVITCVCTVKIIIDARDVHDYYSANTHQPTTKLANKVVSDIYLCLEMGDGQQQLPSWCRYALLMAPCDNRGRFG